MASPAPACKAALAEATRLWPGRNRASDGIMGDPRHAARKSDHNLGNAFDLTHDPAHGVDCHRLAELAAKDLRTTYVIWNRRIFNPSVAPRWRPYSGSNPHTKHMHVSIRASARDDTRPWWRGPQPAPTPTPTQESEMVFVRVKGTPHTFAMMADHLEHVPSTGHLAAINPSGKVTDVPREQLWMPVRTRRGDGVVVDVKLDVFLPVE